MEFEEWLRYYIMDQRLNPTEVIYEGIYEGRFREMNILDIAHAIRQRPLRQKEMRQQLSKIFLTGKGSKEVKAYLREMVSDMEEYNRKHRKGLLPSQISKGNKGKATYEKR